MDTHLGTAVPFMIGRGRVGGSGFDLLMGEKWRGGSLQLESKSVTGTHTAWRTQENDWRFGCLLNGGKFPEKGPGACVPNQRIERE
jgi:hypothetical protein